MLLRTATANGFQMVTSGVQSKAVSDWLIASVEVSAACPAPAPRTQGSLPSAWLPSSALQEGASDGELGSDHAPAWLKPSSGD